MPPGAWSLPVRRLALTTVECCWADAGLPTPVLAPTFDSVATCQTWAEATAVARTNLAAAGISRSAYRAARDRKFDAFARILAPYVAGDVVDVGAGGPDLLERLPASTRITTDIVPSDRSTSGITHVIQVAPHGLPFIDGSVDTVVMTGMAHHLDADVRRSLLADVHRCLRPGGRVAMIEETFSDETGCGAAHEPAMRSFSTDFDALTREDRMTFLQVTDWWGNRVMKGSDEIPLPMTFLTLEEWVTLLAEAGLPVTYVERFGLMSGGGHLATPRALIVGTRP